MDPILTDKLLGVGTPYSGTNMERNNLIGVIKQMMAANKYTADYILDYCQSLGYQYQMASDIFTELTGMNPKVIINNNEYYQNPNFVPSMTLAWGFKKGTKIEAYYVVPFEYGYSVMYKNETETPESKFQYISIDEAVNKLKSLVTKVFTINKIITENCLKNKDLQLNANTVHNVNNPYFSSPLNEMKQAYINKVIDESQFEKKAFRLVAEEKVTLEEAENAMQWLEKLKEEQKEEEFEDIEFGNLKNDKNMDIQEENKQLSGSIQFDEMLEELYTTIGDEYADKNKLKLIYYKNKPFFRGLSKEEAAQKLYELYLGFSQKDIKNKDKYLKKNESQSFEKEAKIVLEQIDGEGYYLNGQKGDYGDFNYDGKYKQTNYYIFIDEQGRAHRVWEFAGKLQASLKKKAADADIELDDIEEKDVMKDKIEEINNTDFNELVKDETPQEYLEDESKNEQVLQMNEKVVKIIDEFTSKFDDFTKYKLQLSSYKLQILNQGYDNTGLSVVEDTELNAQAILQIILTIAPTEDLENSKKALAIFSINKDKVLFNGTLRTAEGFIAFSEEGIDAVFEADKDELEITEDLI